MEEQLERIIEHLKKLIEIGELQKQTNAKLELQFTEILKKKTSGQKTESENDDEIAELKKRITFLEAQLEFKDEHQKKIKQLDDVKFNLVAKLEDLIVENEELLAKNRNLEDRICALEHVDKLRGQQMDGAIEMPVPVMLDKEARKLKSLKDVERILEIQEKTLKTFEKRPTSNFTETLREPKQGDDEDEDTAFDDASNVLDRSKSLIFNKPTEVESFKEKRFSMSRMSLEQNFIESSGILKKPVLLDPQVDDTIQRTNNLRMDHMDPSNNKKQLTKRVRLSLMTPTRSSVVNPNNALCMSQAKEARSDRENSGETFVDFLVGHTSTRTLSLSSSSRNVNKLSNILLGNLSDENFSHKSNAIEIEVISFELAPTSNLLSEDHRFLYVEYSFLGYKGHLLETQSPCPRKINEIVFYRFNQRFEITSKNDEQLKLLMSMVEKNSKHQIKFLVVSEPINLDGDEEEEGECEEIGFAFIKLSEVINKSSNNSETLKADVFSTSYPNELIAFLNIIIVGFSFLREWSKEK